MPSKYLPLLFIYATSWAESGSRSCAGLERGQGPMVKRGTKETNARKPLREAATKGNRKKCKLGTQPKSMSGSTSTRKQQKTNNRNLWSNEASKAHRKDGRMNEQPKSISIQIDISRPGKWGYGIVWVCVRVQKTCFSLCEWLNFGLRVSKNRQTKENWCWITASFGTIAHSWLFTYTVYYISTTSDGIAAHSSTSIGTRMNNLMEIRPCGQMATKSFKYILKLSCFCVACNSFVFITGKNKLQKNSIQKKTVVDPHVEVQIAIFKKSHSWLLFI